MVPLSRSPNGQFVGSSELIINFACRWGFNTDSYQWTQYDVMLDVPQRPSWGAFVEAPEHGLAFYLNGLVTNMSSAATAEANTAAADLGGMVVLDLQNHTVFTPPGTLC